jgi:hypothetical protein
MMEVNLNYTENLEMTEEEKDRIADELLNSVDEKLLSKNWIVRKSAFSEIIGEINHISERYNRKDRSKLIQEYLSKIQFSFEKVLEDNDSGSLETGLQLINLLVKNDRNLSSEKKNEIFKLTIEKAYACSKTPIKEKSKELLVTILQKSRELCSQFEIIKTILEYPIKKIKIIMLAEQILQFLITEYGCKTIDFKFFMPTIVKLVQGTNHGIKYEAMELLKEIFRQIRSDIIPHLREVKETMIKDIRNQFDKIEENEPEPKIVHKVLEKDEEDNFENSAEIENSAPQKETEKNLNITPTNNNSFEQSKNNSSSNLISGVPFRRGSVTSFEGRKEMYLHEIYNDDMVEDLLSKDKKWMDKKEILDEFTKNLYNCKLISESSLNDNENLFYACRQLLKDTNINITQSTLNLINVLSIQLGKPFATYAKEYMPWILEKFKDKKDKLNKEIITTLSSFLKYNLTLDEIVPVLCDVASDKSVQYKLNICEFMLITLRKTYRFILKNAAIDLIDIFDKLSDEQNVEIRNTALNCLALIKVRLFDYVMDEGLMDEINENKMVKIDELTKMINYDKSYDVDSSRERVVESPIKITVKKTNDNNFDQFDFGKTDKIEKQQARSINEKNNNISETKNDVPNNVVIIKNKAALIDIPNEPKLDNFNAIKENTELNKKSIQSKNKSPVEISVDPKLENEKNEFEVQIISKKNPAKSKVQALEIPINDNSDVIEIPVGGKKNPAKSKAQALEIPISDKSDVMEIPVGGKKNQFKANDFPMAPKTENNEEDGTEVIGGKKNQDLEEFERKLEEAMKKENEKQNEDTVQTKKKPAPKKPATKKAEAVPADTNNNQKGNAEEEDDSSKLSKDEIEDKINSLLGSEATILLSSTKWDEKKNGLILLNDWITENTNSNFSLIQNNLENIVVFVKIKLKDYKEMNFNIVREAMNIFTNLISNFSGKGFEKRLSLGILRGFAEKIADVKLKENMSNLLYAMMENQGPKFIMTNLLKIMEKKAPSNNALKEYSAFFEKAIDDFGIGLTPVKEIIELCKQMAANTNPQVRNASTSLICVLYKYVGKDIRTLLKDIKESTLKVIEAELEKITVLDANAINALPKRQLKAAALKEEGLITTATNKASSNKNAAVNNIMDSLIPRVDISKKITPKHIKDINDGKWPEKKEAVEYIEKVMADANNKILPTGLNEVFGMIKARLSDGNKNVVRLVVSLLSKLIDSIGPPFKSFTKPLGTPLLNNLSDKQQLLRDDVMTCMEKWVAQCGLETIIIYIPILLQKQENFEMRTELFRFLHKYKESFVFIKDKVDLKEFIPSMLSCLQDKTISIRNSADELIAYLLRFVPLNAFMNGLKDFKTAIANTLKTLLEKYKGMNMEEPLELNGGSQNLNHKINKSSERKNSDNSMTPKKNKKDGTPVENKNKINIKQESSNNLNQKDLNSNNSNPNLSLIKVGKNLKGSENVNNSIYDQQPDREKNQKYPMSPQSKAKKSSNNNLNQLNFKDIFLPTQNSKNSKEKRLDIDKRYKFNLDTINEDFEIKLKEQLKQIVTTEILEKLFHQDLKHNIDVLVTFGSIIRDNGLLISGMYDNLDLILKWVGWKAYNNQNPLLIKFVIEFCDTLIEKLGENELGLNETEGYILVAVLVDKLANNNNKLREISKILLEKSIIYVSAKISTLISSSAGKTSKVKLECIDMCTDIVSNMGVNIAPQKDIRTIAKMLNTNDINLKNSIIKFLGEIYTEIKENLWAILNDIPEKTKEMLYSKFAQMGMIPVEESNPDSIEEHNQESEEEEEYPRHNKKNSQDYSYKDMSVKTTGNVSQSSIISNNSKNSNIIINTNNPYLMKNSESIPNMPHKIKPDYNEELMGNSFVMNNQKIIASTNNSNLGMSPGFLVENITDKNELMVILNSLNTGEISERVNTILMIHELIFTRFNQTKHILIPNIDMIIKSFILGLKILFQNKDPYDIPLKLGKYLLTVLYKISSNKELIKNISYNVLFDLSEEVLTNLLIENLDKIGENQEGLIIVRSLNSTMLRILENCNYTEVITILLELVKKYRTHEIKSKISGLAIKCLLKINQVK